MKKRFLALATLLCLICKFADGAEVYMANRFNTSITVIDTVDFDVIATITTGAQAANLAFGPDPSTLFYFGGTNPPNLQFIDTQSKQIIATITIAQTVQSTDQPLATNLDGSLLFAGNTISGNVTVIDTASKLIIATITTTGTPNGFTRIMTDLAPLPDGSYIYVSLTTNTTAPPLRAIDPITLTVVATIATSGLGPIVASPDSRFIYGGTDTGSSIIVASTETNTIIATITTNSGTPFRTTGSITPDGSYVYFNSRLPSGHVIAIDTSTLLVIATITVTDPLCVLAQQNGTLGVIGTNTVGETLEFSTETQDLTGRIITAPIRGYHLAEFAEPSSPPPPPPPSSPSASVSISIFGATETNEFLVQEEIFNIITWASTGYDSISHYKLYRDAARTDLIATVPNTASNSFKDHNRIPKTTYTYFLDALDSLGAVLDQTSISLTTP